ncbi:PKD1L2 [Mytilus coruscus]|uniref:PKD1L2 n=1 Tax=Mytilus coruscus TaxID=42192 RepID=A0A6J8BYL0_MYTCO|nr:PKD1L2 [Mytilus coruscus]
MPAQNPIALSEATITTTWNSWGACTKISGSLDQNCRGTQTRTGVTVDSEAKTTISTSQTGGCYLTYDKIDGGYTTWSEWDDCSQKCDQRTTRRRTCHNPTPCNGGEDCSQFGRDTLTKDCGPVAGQWGEWGAWGSCAMPAGSGTYGTGTYQHSRTCDNPVNICGGDDCIGINQDEGNCRVVPPCLTYQMFSDKFLKIDSAMSIYTSAQVDIYLLTKNKCTTATIIHTYFELYKITNITANTEVQVGEKQSGVKFKFKPGEHEIGYYRLYAKIGYPANMAHWMEESMYVKIEQPPPHAFIKGGAGRTIGQGLAEFDARSVSYSLTNGPGDPSGLIFSWRCLNFVTHDIYNLLQFNIDPILAFKDISNYKKKWYETNFVPYIENKVAFIDGSTLDPVVKSLKNSNSRCMYGSEFYVKAEPNKYPPANKNKGDKTEANSTSPATTFEPMTTTPDTAAPDTTAPETTTEETTTTVPPYDRIPLTRFFDIDFMYEMESKPKSELKDTQYVLPFPGNNTLVLNEMLEFLNDLYGEESDDFLQDTDDFFERLSDSSLTLDSLYKLSDVTGLPASANATFFYDLLEWLQNANVSKEFAYALRDLLNSFEHVQSYVKSATELVDLIGIEGYFKLIIDDSGQCLMNYLGDIFDGFTKINSFDWNRMKNQEKYYLNWLEQELFNSSACKLFNGIDDGTGSLTVTSQDVSEGKGFLVYIRVEFEESISYFIQHAQSDTGNPPVLDIECRLNCMKKTALTSIMSLKATCPSCTYEQQKGFKFWWKVKDFDIFSRKATKNNYWESWMLSELGTNSFVMQANVLNASAGYLIEALMELATGETSIGIWIVNTNILPYGGSCEIEDAIWGEKKVTTNGWNDEGFRTSTDTSYDWKEQLNYRIVQTNSVGKETLLYYGSEEENHIKVKPGIDTDNYNVTIKIQIYDIFIDYTECTKHIGQILPDYTTSDQTSVSSFLHSSAESVEYYWKTGNVKQVAMNAEVAGTPVTDLNTTRTIFDTDPAQWVNIGVEIQSDGTNVTKTFDELWNMYEHPDYGDVITQSDIIEQLTNFSTILAETSNAVDGTSTVNLDQVANSIGTIIGNKLFTANSSASKAFDGNKGLLEKLKILADNETYPKYEDYISTCQGMLRVLNNALEAILPKTSVDTPTTLDIYTIMSDISSRQELSEPNDADLTPAERAFIASQIAMKNELDAELKNDVVKNEVQILLDSISDLGHVLQRLNYRKQMPVYVQNGHINSTEDKKLIAELIQNGFQNNEVDLNFVESDSQSPDEQAVQVTLYDHTPFSWDEESKFISSKTVTVSVGEGNTTNSAIPSKIKLQNTDLVPTRKTINIAIPIDKNDTTSQMLSYKMYWKTPADSLILSINNAMDHLNHTIYIRKAEPPTEEEYDWKKSTESSNWLTTSEIKVVVDRGLYTAPTNVYIGVLVQKETSSAPTLTRRRRSLSTTIVEYEIIGATVGCRVWDTVKQKWDKTSCQLSAASTINETVCECTNPPGNSFATTFYVPPNTIDFGSVIDKFDLKNNAAVFATVVSVVLLYILLCVWAFRQDRKDHTRWALSYLSDNGPYDDYLYILTVFTGLHRNAGTKSRIGFMIIDGKPKKSHFYEPDVRILDDETHRGFGVGSIRKFVMSVPKQIHDPTVLKIWHDNSGQGNSASWYLNKIMLEDVQTSERYLFICDQWLSLDHDDSSIDCAIPVSDKLDKHKFSFLFHEKTRQNTTDNHLWLSVAIRPEDSNFTRIERSACCLTLLFLTMISNAMFYGQNTGSQFSIGPIKLSLSGIYISLISAIIAAPPIFLVSYMFRSSRHRKTTEKKPLPNTEEFPDITLQSTDKTDAETHPKADVTDDTQFSLPFWCRYVAWGIVTLAVFLSGFFLILYSMEWGKTKSEEWLLCFFMSFIESMLLVDPIKIILLSLLFSWIVKSYQEKTVKYDREKLLLETKRRAASPFSYHLDVYKKKHAPLKPKKLAKLKEKGQQRLLMQEIFIELVLYMIFLAVLYCVSFSNRDSRWYNVKNHLEQHLVTSNNIPVGDSTLKYDQVKTASNLYVWIDETLIPFLFPRYHTNGDQVNADKRLYVQDQVNFRVGPMRLRQLRAVQEPCRKQFWGNFTCYDEYSIYGEDDGNYCVAWEPHPCVRGQAVYNMTSAAWNFVSSVDIWGLPVTGLHSTYGGGGYIAEFIVNYNISRLILSDLYKYTWIDRKTRAIFTEFTLYNVDDNVFVFMTFLTEFPETGGVIASTSIKPFRPYQHIGSLGITTVRNKPVRSTYGITNIVASFWKEAVCLIIASNNATSKDKIKLSPDYILSKEVPRQIEIIRQEATKQMEIIKPKVDLTKKKIRPRRIYQ